MQEKYLSQLGVTAEMIDKQTKITKQPSQGSGTAAPQSQPYSKTNQSTTAHQRTSSSNQKVIAGGRGDEEKNAVAAADKRQVYAQARPESSQGKSQQNMVKQSSTGNYASALATKTAAVNNYTNQYSSQVYASKPSTSQSSSMTSTQYAKMSQSGTNFAKKK